MAITRTIANHYPRLRELHSCGPTTLEVVAVVPEHTVHAVRDREVDLQQKVVLARTRYHQFNSIQKIRMEKYTLHVREAVIQSVLSITVNMRQVSEPAICLSEMSVVHESTWTMLKEFYRRLRALSEMEVLNLGIKSKESQWLNERGQERIAVGTRTITRTPQDNGRSDDDDDGVIGGGWTLKDDDPNTRRGDLDELDTSAMDASFPGFCPWAMRLQEY
ncbi:hypothetical protein KI688_004182 [Linnemannia hyalina]|uniref:Uncharacterized protein n=1 Tax=Linnemannia hyalina TaxID=64524 RepID=A0A9P7XL01_9FUNG|nr:hypothetical protein KI688_004182 [Linnemannia hyalina]